MTDTQLLAWGRQEFDRQMAEDRQERGTCHRCGSIAAEYSAGWARCGHCSRPVCERCAVQLDGCIFCPGCPPELPF